MNAVSVSRNTSRPLRVVAIDGPAGAGKSTIARLVARELGFDYLDTGAMYRAATWYVLRLGVPMDNPEALTAAVGGMELRVEPGPGGARVWVNGTEVTDVIRTPEITANIWRVDEVPGVRQVLVARQREFGETHDTVAEGRDMGTVVFPDAPCKIYMDASPECRAQRRASELSARGLQVDVEQVLRDIVERDRKNMTRAVSPLRPAEDAVILDTTDSSLEEVSRKVLAIARERLGLGS
ncbi:MAG TPA: (d)CMP kinase [Candidatus Hydrogenedentes bacterium]|nr:(d)CMP kinase [Candidatus Hydrogenedentota bacterium]HOJ68401.1 (d)CMP kinase [Candidatus Hydrogenedentota bacterium]HOK89081.1 (d)CMP kinase [Candidatus Hydrogenedentota bacterium]HPO31393.1 (d)CMP kinase [Candidatus Hydrogenedentota bacterium]